MFYIAQFIYNILIGFWAIIPTHDLGIAIILVTVIIRLIMWPLDKKSLHGRKAMQDIQPDINRIKKEAAGDKQKEYQLLTELYKEKEINPIGASCLPALIQFPVLIAIYQVFRLWLEPAFLAERTYPFIHNLPYVQQAIQNPSLFYPTFFGLDITKLGAGWPFILFPIAAAILQYLQIRSLTPKTQSDDPQQKMLASLNYLGPGMIFFFGLSLPIALTLYWASMSLFALLQQHLILSQDVEEIEEEGNKVSQSPKKKHKKKKK